MTARDVPSFAALLQRHRLRAGLTQEELAERAGLSVRGISDLERGIKTRPHAFTLRQLAAALDLTPATRIAFEEAARRRVSDSQEARPAPIGAYLGARSSGILVGRADELRRIMAALDAVEAGQGRVILLAGEPGAGKTRLAQEAALLARDRGFVLGTGRCYQPEQQVPFYPFPEALSQLYMASSPLTRAEIPERWPYLGRLLPEAEFPPPIVGLDAREEQLRLFRAVTGFVQALAEHGPVALLLDDLHWVDGSSLRLLLHLARFTHGDRILLLGTYRDGEIRQLGTSWGPLEAATWELDREGLLEQVKVQTLNREEATALMAALGVPDPPPELTETIYRLSDGNPFFVQQLLRVCVEQGDFSEWASGRHSGWAFAYEAEGAPILPEGVRSLIRHRLAHLTDEAQEILREASVLGQQFDFDDLRTMRGRTEDEVEEALEQAHVAGLVRPPEGDVYSFDHALTQEALLSDLTPHKKRRLHRAAAEAIDQTGQTPPERQK